MHFQSQPALWKCCGQRAAYSFFDLGEAPELESNLLDSVDFSVATVRALAFLVFLGHLSVKCPVPLQNIQRLLSRQCFLSTAMRLPSFPNLSFRSGFKDPGKEVLDGGEVAELPDLDFSFPVLEVEVPSELEGLVVVVVWLLLACWILSLCSQ